MYVIIARSNSSGAVKTWRRSEHRNLWTKVAVAALLLVLPLIDTCNRDREDDASVDFSAVQ